ncbi:SGNH/GDSL hydrolase family protein [Lactobacillus sp. CBA3605]|uniref:SGNH/GDSL hydrolase family protein n=1 Tax=Lactobacillus sp. CBA3605 TaxID=2099788 RepID=UPI0018F8AFDA|nr:SGNH/GDSL hydrolase family protein [Lactobacillus sp. CBA3605]
MAIQLVTDQFSDNLDGTFRNGMVGNFKIVEQTLNELLTYQGNINKQLNTLTKNINSSVDGKLTKQDLALVDKLKTQSQGLTERINHIIMGTDTDSIHAVLNNMKLAGELKGQCGDTGKAGRDGLDGESAYQVWLDAGNVGSKADYLASMKGSKGDVGSVGPAGKDGAMSAKDVTAMVTDSINGISIGTTNLLLYTKFTLTTVTNIIGWVQVGRTAPVKTDLTGKYTFEGWIDTAIDKAAAYIDVRDKVTDKQLSIYTNRMFVEGGDSGYAASTVDIPENAYIKACWLGYTSEQTTPISITYGREKFVYGDKITDWSPAPDDKVTDNHDGSITVNGKQVNVTGATSVLQGKTLDIIGDSYVANNGQSVSETWHYKVANQYDMIYNNYGVNGNGLITAKATGTPVVDRVTDMDSTADYVVVVGGKNDYNQQLAIADFKAGLVKLIQELIERFIGKKICFFTPWSIVESEIMNIPLVQYSQAIEDVCGAYSIPCFNSAKRSGILAYSDVFRAKYFQTSTDQSHLNDAGHTLFVNPATKFLESL